MSFDISDSAEMDIGSVSTHLVANLIQYRIQKLEILGKELNDNIKKVYAERDERRRTRLCNRIRKNVTMMVELINKNIDDVSNLESTINTFKTKNDEIPYIR